LNANFYTVPYLAAVGQSLTAQGIGVLSANTRAHDGLANLQSSVSNPPLGGSAYESLDAARLDLAAWLDWLASQGQTRVLLIGHGFGAVKVAVYAAEAGDERVAGVALLSPPDGAYYQRALGQRLDEALAWSLLMLEAGQADELVALDGLGYLSARTMRDLFGLRGALNRFDADPAHDWSWLGTITVPLLVAARTDDPLSVEPRAWLAQFERHVRGAPSVTLDYDTADVGALLAQWTALWATKKPRRRLAKTVSGE
jgi:pimeloyl-ACP methyl ester carboxylesterase